MMRLASSASSGCTEIRTSPSSFTESGKTECVTRDDTIDMTPFASSSARTMLASTSDCVRKIVTGSDMLNVDFTILDHVSLAHCEAQTRRALRYEVPSRGTGTGRGHWRDHHADLPDIDVRSGGARQAQGVRIRQ